MDTVHRKINRDVIEFLLKRLTEENRKVVVKTQNADLLGVATVSKAARSDTLTFGFGNAELVVPITGVSSVTLGATRYQIILATPFRGAFE